MAELNAKLKAINALRRFPFAYNAARLVWRYLNKILVESARFVGCGISIGGPKSTFSGLERLQAGTVPGIVYCTSQELPQLPRRSLIREADMKQNEQQPWPVFCLHLAHCRLVGPSLLPLDEKKRIMIEAAYGEEFFRSDPSYNYVILPPTIELTGPWTSVIGRWSEGFYHWFTDALPRLAALEEFPENTKILFRGPMKRYQEESLRVLGLLDRMRETKETHLTVEDFYFSSPVGMTGCTNPASVKWLREAFLPHAAPGNFPAKVFIQREGKTRGVSNKKEVADLFVEKGWWVVDLEELTFAEQIAVFSRATHIVGEHGAGFTNILWCNSQCHTIELCADNYLNGCYEGISICIGFRHTFQTFQADQTNQFFVPRRALDNIFNS